MKKLIFILVLLFSSLLMFGQQKTFKNIFLSNGSIWITDATGADSARIYDDGDTTRINSDNPFQMNQSLKLPGGSLIIGSVTVSDDNGCLATNEFHAHGVGGVSGYFKINQGTTPTAHAEADHNILWIDSSENLYFEKADGTDTKIIKDDGSGKVGIGTNSPYYHLTVMDSSGTDGPTFGLKREDDAVGEGNRIGRIAIMGGETGSGNTVVGSIVVDADAGWTNGSSPTRMQFHTTSSGSTVDTERMRIDSDGRIQTVPASPYDMGTFTASASAFTALPSSGTDDATVAFRVTATGTGTAMLFGQESSTGGWIQVSNSTDLSTTYPLQLQPNGGDVHTVPWTDYGSTSTTVGWAATPTKNIWYKKIGNLVFVNFYINGTSNATNATFTLPYTPASSTQYNIRISTQGADNGAWLTTPAMGSFGTGSNVVTVYKDWGQAAGWTASGVKQVMGEFWYESQ